jgi:hypothetical protein
VNAADFAARLDRARSHGGYWTARCPAHDDHSPSLSVRDLDGYVTVKCFSGCDTDAIASAVGLTRADLRPDPDDADRILDTYDYRDLDGNLLYQVVRWVPKKFTQQRPKPGGGWLANLTGVERVPYRLPELRAAIDAGRQVIVVEGERDVHRLEREGLVATTTSGGAKGWRPEYAAYFAGAPSVAIVADNDPAGEGYATAAAADLARVVGRVRVVRLPDLALNGDVTDWLRIHSRADLVAAIKGTAEWGKVTAPTVTERPGQVTLDWPDSAVVILIDRITWIGGHVHAEVTVTLDGRKLVAYQRANLQSASAARDLATELRRREDAIDWHPVIDAGFHAGVENWRGTPRFELIDHDEPVEPPRWLIPDLWADMTRPSLLFGDSESTKSALALCLAVSIASGVAIIPGAPPMRVGPVAYLDWEDDRDRFRHRLALIRQANGLDPWVYQSIYYQRPHTPLTVDTAEALAVELGRLEAVAVVVDSRQGGQAGSLIADDDTRGFVRAVIDLGIPAEIVDHLDKASTRSAKAVKHSYGSVFARAGIACSWYVRKVRSSDAETTVTLFDGKWSHGPDRPPRSLVVDWTEGLAVRRLATPVVGDDDEGTASVWDEIVGLLVAHPGGFTGQAIADQIGRSSSTVRGTLNRKRGTSVVLAGGGSGELQQVDNRWLILPDPM